MRRACNIYPLLYYIFFLSALISLQILRAKRYYAHSK